MLLMFCDFLPIMCSLGCHPMFLCMSSVLEWCRPRSVHGIGICLSSTGSLLSSWTHSYVSWMLRKPYLIGGSDGCCVLVFVVFCRIWYRPSEGYVFVLPPLWGSLSTRMTACRRKRRLIWVDRWPWSNGSSISCICASLYFLGLISGVKWGVQLFVSP